MVLLVSFIGKKISIGLVLSSVSSIVNTSLSFLKSLAGGSVLLKVTVWVRGCLDPKGKGLEWKVTDLTFPVFFVGDEGRCRGKSFPIF